MANTFEVTAEVLSKINEYSVKELTAEEIFCFSVILCDNDIDRDNERFSTEALKTLSELFKGKTGIFDHDLKAENQTARIFDTAVKQYPEKQTADSKPYFGLVGYAYMIRTEDNKSLISQIEGGIKKEVSVSCQISKKICSVCGADQTVNPCMHIKGNSYGGEICFVSLEEPTDAYEWSFVAVPAQKNAGVIKKFTKETDAAKNREEALRQEILKLSYFAKPYETAKAVSQITSGMGVDRLTALRNSLSDQIKGQNGNNSFITAKSEDSDCYKI